MNRKQTSLAVLGAILLVPALLTGCSAKGDAGPTSSRSASDGAGAAGSAERIAALGECMRDAGYEFDDAATGFAVPDGVDRDAYTTAVQRCAAQTGGGGEPAQQIGGTPEEDAELAACLSDAGLPDVPESQADFGPWVDGLSDADKQRFDDSIRTCSQQLMGSDE